MLTLSSCHSEESAGNGGVVTLHISTGALQKTKATVPGDGDIDEGGGLYVESSTPDLVLLIANSAGNIVMTYPGSGATLDSYVEVSDSGNPSATEATLTLVFTSLPAGEYTVYAFGNTEGLWPMTYDPSNSGISLSGSDLTSLTTAAQVEALQFVAQSRNTIGWEEPDNDPIKDGISDAYNALPREQKFDEGVTIEDRLPVSAKASLTVTAGKNGEAYLELLRCVAKVTAIIINNTNEAMGLYNYMHTVHNINPTSGYVIPHEGSDVTGSPANLIINPCAKYDDPDVAIPVLEDTSMEYDWYVFPSEGPFTVCIRFTLYKDNVGGTEATYIYKKLPITNWRAQDIPALGRNQHLIVETRLSKGVRVSFNFRVTDWTEHTSTVSFD